MAQDVVGSIPITHPQRGERTQAGVASALESATLHPDSGLGWTASQRVRP